MKICTLMCVFVITFAGCATKGINLSKNGSVEIERIASENIFIPWADAYQDSNDLMISGVVERRYQTAGDIKTYIEVQIVDASGQLLKQARTADIHVPPKVPHRALKWEHFDLTIPMIAPNETIIRLVVHRA